MREEGVVAIHLPVGPLKICSGLEPVLRYKPSTHCTIGASVGMGGNLSFYALTDGVL